MSERGNTEGFPSRASVCSPNISQAPSPCQAYCQPQGQLSLKIHFALYPVPLMYDCSAVLKPATQLFVLVSTFHSWKQRPSEVGSSRSQLCRNQD